MNQMLRSQIMMRAISRQILSLNPACRPSFHPHDEIRRKFHATQKAEVLPIIAAGIGIAVAATGIRYLIRAGKRMKEIEEEEQLKRSEDALNPDKNIDASQHVAGSALGPAFGVDFGVLSMRLGVCLDKDKSPVIVENKEGSRSTPAMISYGMVGGSSVIGQLAKAQRWQMPKTTILGIQPFLGLKFDNPAFKNLTRKIQYPLIDIGNDEIGVQIDDSNITLTKAVVDMLENMRALKDHKVGTGGAVMFSAPPQYDEKQKATLIEAGQSAGFNVIGTIEEPIAVAKAALNLGLFPNQGENRLVAIVDVGGRCMSCSIVDLSDKDEESKLVSTSVCDTIGGEHIEDLLVSKMNSQFKKRNNGLDLLGDALSISRLYEAAEMSKIELSKGQTTSINLPFITADQTGPKHLEMDLSLAQFERIIDPLFDNAADPCDEALRLAGKTVDDISAVLLVGGCSRIPRFQEFAERHFKKPPILAQHSEELVVFGATLEARKKIFST